MIKKIAIIVFMVVLLISMTGCVGIFDDDSTVNNTTVDNTTDNNTTDNNDSDGYDKYDDPNTPILGHYAESESELDSDEIYLAPSYYKHIELMYGTSFTSIKQVIVLQDGEMFEDSRSTYRADVDKGFYHNIYDDSEAFVDANEGYMYEVAVNTSYKYQIQLDDGIFTPWQGYSLLPLSDIMNETSGDEVNPEEFVVLSEVRDTSSLSNRYDVVNEADLEGLNVYEGSMESSSLVPDEAELDVVVGMKNDVMVYQFMKYEYDGNSLSEVLKITQIGEDVNIEKPDWTEDARKR